MNHHGQSFQSRRTPPAITQQRIIQAALELLQENGLEGLSQRRLAAKLHVQAPALYWHFKNKEVLVDHLAQAILAQEFPALEPRAHHESWQDWLEQIISRLRRAMLAYPDGARVVAGAHLFPAVALAMIIDTSIASLHSAGIELRNAGHIVATAMVYTFGSVIEEQSAPTAQEVEQLDIPAFLKPFPHLAASFFDDDFTPEAIEQQFLIGLRIIIRGAESL